MIIALTLCLLVWAYSVTAVVTMPGKTCEGACKGLDALKMN